VNRLELARVRTELWDLYDELRAQEVDAEEAGARCSVLDSLSELLRVELEGERAARGPHERDEQKRTPKGGPWWRRS
jgi:hypothetical protein